MSSESKKTASRCTMEAETGTHTFEIVGYSLIGVGRSVRSATFTVGGYDWAIRFYAGGPTEASKHYVATIVELVSTNAEVRARYILRFDYQPPAATTQTLQIQMMGNRIMGSMARFASEGPRLFKSCDDSRFGAQNSGCVREQSLVLGYVRDDRLTIECELTVIKDPQLSGNNVECDIDVPPFDMMEHFGKLLREKDGADVTFSVAGDSFEAHKIVLAARSPVFKALFYGQMRESRTSQVTVQDMQPAVFSAFLHFIYNDSLPYMGDLAGNDYGEMMRHLLVAADRYAMERLKLICQSIIRKNLHVDNVATTLALADQYNCDRLKAACIEFIASSINTSLVVATQGYANLKRTCPSVFVDLFEKIGKPRKT